MTLRFDQPEWFLALLLLLPLGWAGLVAFRAMSGVRRWSAIVARGGVLLVLAAMLAEASSVRTTDRLAVVAVVDVSGSVRSFAPPVSVMERDQPRRMVPVMEGVRAFLARASAGRGPEDLLGVVVFDGSAVTLAAPTAGPLPDGPLDTPVSEGTDLAGALRLAAAVIPPDAAGRIVVFSDGVETRPGGLAAAREVSGESRGGGRGGRGRVPIDVVPLRYVVEREVMVESLDAPPRAVSGAPMTLRVALFSTAPVRGVLRVFDDNEELSIGPDGGGEKGRALQLGPGRTVELVTVQPPSGRVHRLSARFDPESPGPGGAAPDLVATNNQAEAFTLTPSGGTVLLLDGVGGEPGQALAKVLREEGLEVDLRPADAMPADLLRLQPYDLVILQNVPADAMGDEGQARLSAYVQELGGGLLVVGGPDAFAAGGYKGGALEPILPVGIDLPDKIVMPAAAVMLVIDCSGSMAWRVSGTTRSQQEVANEGAATVTRALTRQDLLGCISFSGGYDTVIPLSRNTDPDANAKKILTISAEGGTNLPPALREAYRQIKAAEAKTKHVIVLSDGVSMGREQLEGLAQRMAKDGIKVSAIAIGDGADGVGMEQLAAAGGGEYYRVIDPRILPRIFMKAVRVVRTPLVREVPFTPEVLAPSSPYLQGMPAGMPPLGGLTLTSARPEKTITLALANAEGEPVMAHWQAGLGRVACFTSDAHRWAQGWQGWPGYRRLWTQWARATARAAAERDTELSIETGAEELVLRVAARGEDKAPLSGLEMPVVVYGPDGTRTTARLAQTGPGVYEGRVRAEQAGNYVVTISPRREGRAMAPLIGGAARASGPEFRSLRSNDAAMEAIAQATGGRVFEIDAPPTRESPPERRLFDRSTVKARESRTPLWPLLAPLAVGLFLLDVGTRRVAWDRLFGEGMLSTARQAVRDRSEQAARTLTGLKKRDAELETAPAPVALGAEEARQVATAARAARRAARAGGEPASTTERPVRGAGAGPKAGPDGPSPTGSEEGGLLAAKRRARERFKGE
ncbi:MAG: VWA domain-containing protein [Phycisphaerales bacterium]